MSGQTRQCTTAELCPGDRVLINGSWFDFEGCHLWIDDEGLISLWFSHKASAVYGRMRCTPTQRITVDRPRFNHEPAVERLLTGEHGRPGGGDD